MKKTVLVLLAVSVMVLMMAGVANAEGWWTPFTPTHYNFSLTSEGCAGCHVTHTAPAPYLLIAGPNQTDFCYMCHAGTIASPYNVDDGVILDPDDMVTENASTAGGFNLLLGNNFNATSTHSVQWPAQLTANVYAQSAIPGSTIAAGIADFRCGSCHDPHAGDKTNDRLLRATIDGVTVDLVNFVYDTGTLKVTDYAFNKNANDALNGWCGLCHGKFNGQDDDAKTGYMTKYRHAMGVPVDPTKTTLDNYLGVKNAGSLATNNFLNCLSCHYAHGSEAAAMTGYKTWTRDLAGSYTETDSTLLRMDKRGVCFDCHGAAANNVEAVGQGNT